MCNITKALVKSDLVFILLPGKRCIDEKKSRKYVVIGNNLKIITYLLCSKGFQLSPGWEQVFYYKQ